MNRNLSIRDTMILTAGPSITEREVNYVMDAVKTGWNFHHSDYIERFEKALASYVGIKHALGTTNGTSSLHLALRLFGVGPGDEVILPDMTYVACANVIVYTGAKPVFADIDPKTWCLDTDDLRRKITSKTKVVMPVWMYGNAPDIEAILETARKHHLFVLQDACPALGTTLNGRQAGSFGDAGAFSFQGAKIAAIGEGGALVTNNPEFYERARSLYDHGRDYERQFWVKEAPGHMYKMSNLHAAIGLAQLERIEEFVAKKRQVFEWYRNRLADIPFLSMNAELPGVRSNIWMSSIVLKENSPMGREALRTELKKRMIDTRPFFYPITMFPDYAHLKTDTPNAYRIGLSGINLPSGVALTEEDIDYVANHIKDILGV